MKLSSAQRMLLQRVRGSESPVVIYRSEVQPAKRLHKLGLITFDDESCRADKRTRDQVIWSGEHGAWWRPDAAGYTKELVAAGLYSRAEAEHRTRGCGLEKRISIMHVRDAWSSWWGCGPGDGTVGAALGLDALRPPWEDAES